MAKKPFYSMDEVCAKLGKSQDQIKGLVRDGALREFRDAGKVFFKAEDIDKLAGSAEPASKEDTGEILLEPAGDMETLPSGDDMPALTEASSGGTSMPGRPLSPASPRVEGRPPTAVVRRHEHHRPRAARRGGRGKGENAGPRQEEGRHRRNHEGHRRLR